MPDWVCNVSMNTIHLHYTFVNTCGSRYFFTNNELLHEYRDTINYILIMTLFLITPPLFLFFWPCFSPRSCLCFCVFTCVVSFPGKLGSEKKGWGKMRMVIVPLVWSVYPLVLVIALEIRKINETSVFFGTWTEHMSHLLSLCLSSAVVSNIKKQSGHASLHDRLSVTFKCFHFTVKNRSSFRVFFPRLDTVPLFCRGCSCERCINIYPQQVWLRSPWAVNHPYGVV